MMHECHPVQPAAMPLVFVYGTLRSGEINDINRLKPAPRRLGSSTLRGVLYDLGAYPGLLLQGSLQPNDPLCAQCVEVLGDVYAIDPSLEAMLDEIEEVYPQQSGEYRRRHVEAVVHGQAHVVLLYEIARERVQGKPMIQSGDWVSHRSGRAVGR